MIKTGELAKRSGLTIRTLRYYDSIGLLKPSARSVAGYRLYNDDDIVRLRNIQGLRDLGFPLADIQKMLDVDGAPLSQIVSRQLEVLDREISRATEIRDQLSVLQSRVDSGSSAKAEDWLPVLELMSVHRKYMTASEFKMISERRKDVEAKLLPLSEATRNAIKKQLLPESPEVQSLARRWMDISMNWMQNDCDLVARWWQMSATETASNMLNGDEQEIQRFISKPVGLRHAIVVKYLTPNEMKRFHKGLEERWVALEKAVKKAIRQKVAIDSDAAKQLAAQWNEIMDDLTDHDPVIKKKFIAALENEPFLQLGSPLSAEVRGFVRRAGANLKV